MPLHFKAASKGGLAVISLPPRLYQEISPRLLLGEVIIKYELRYAPMSLMRKNFTEI
jgi:hypothetical protein